MTKVKSNDIIAKSKGKTIGFLVIYCIVLILIPIHCILEGIGTKGSEIWFGFSTGVVLVFGITMLCMLYIAIRMVKTQDQYRLKADCISMVVLFAVFFVFIIGVTIDGIYIASFYNSILAETIALASIIFILEITLLALPSEISRKIADLPPLVRAVVVKDESETPEEKENKKLKAELTKLKNEEMKKEIKKLKKNKK